MSKQDIETVVQLAAHLSRITAKQMPELPGSFAARAARVAAMQLQKLGRRAHRLAERDCNGTLTEAQHEQELERILSAVAVQLKPYALSANITGDPRGYCLKIMGLPGNTWGGDESGFGI